MDLGSYYSGKVISSGLFSLWFSEGILSQLNLKLASSVSLIFILIYSLGGFIHFYISMLSNISVNKLTTISTHHLLIFINFGLISWSGHMIHISLPLNKIVISSLFINLVPYPHDLLFLSTINKIFPGFLSSILIDLNVFLSYSGSSLLGLLIDPTIGSLSIAASSAHHYYLAIFCIIAALLLRNLKLSTLNCLLTINISKLSSNLILSFSLVLFSSSSFIFAHHSYAVPVYPFLSIDYTTLFSLF